MTKQMGWGSTPTERLPPVSVIVPVFDQKESLVRCLDALCRQDYGGPFEVIVVNNGTAGELDDLCGRFSQVVFVEELQPGSYRARNAGVGRAKASLLAFTDADCVPESDWLSNGVRPLLADHRCGLVGGRVKLVPGDPRQVTAAELYDMTFGFRQRNYVERAHFAATANMLTRRDVLESVGSFRGDLLSGGDAEWGQRVFAAGYSLVYADAAVVGHPARTYPDLLKKLRRAAAGARDRNPGWMSCLRECLKRLPPIPLHTLRLIVEARDRPLNARQKLQLAGFVTYLRWRTAFERLRLQFARNESPRS